MSHTRIILPVVLEHAELPASLKAASLRDWVSNPDSAKYYVLTRRRNYGQSGPIDPWRLRQEFLGWPPELWQGFVEIAGALGPFKISRNDFVEWQNLFREALIRHPREWRGLEADFDQRKVCLLFEPLPIRFVWDGESPQALIRSAKAFSVIIATIQLDLLNGAKFKICARPDCINPPFKVENRHKIYCSPECAHLVAVRNSRARAARGKGKGRQIRKKAKLRG